MYTILKSAFFLLLSVLPPALTGCLLGSVCYGYLKIRVKGKDGNKYFAHTLNNTVVAPPRMLIAFLENNLNADGSVNIPKALQPYMGGKEKLIPLD